MLCKTLFHQLQLRLLRKNDDVNGDTLEDNYRPTQDLNSRTVHYYSV